MLVGMIKLTSRNGTLIEVETHLIKDITSVPETLITTTAGATYIVKESVADVVALFASHHSPGEILRYYSPTLRILASRARFRHEICALNTSGMLHPRRHVSPLERFCRLGKWISVTLVNLLKRQE